MDYRIRTDVAGGSRPARLRFGCAYESREYQKRGRAPVAWPACLLAAVVVTSAVSCSDEESKRSGDGEASAQGACSGSKSEACLKRGVGYWYGWESETDQAKAVELFEQACEAGEMEACMFWAFALQEGGDGVAKDPVRGAELLEHSCQNGSMPGCDMLGTTLLEGVGVERDVSRAAELFAESCDGGWMVGCTNRGLALVHGEGVEPDPARGVKLLETSCEQDVELGCYNLGAIYQRGLGVPADPDRAERFFQRACELGSDDGCRQLEGTPDD